MPKTRKQRDYRAEYQRRISRALATGKSRSAARGHPRAADLPKPEPSSIDRTAAVERALGHMRRGLSQSAAAKVSGVSVEALRRHRLLHTQSLREGRRWVIFDLRPQSFWIASQGKVVAVTLTNDEGSLLSSYWRAVNRFLETNDDEHLFPFEGDGLYDVKGRYHPYETRPNVLRKMEAVDDLNFIEIYADVQ
ncbi:hypothetical protein [Brevundimonas sp.]|uniref:hypothetical protein n=1 Tax=Brevundimonas sp. TaxID=1871086 RepID=UPI00272F7970|nr:hypothetical protein [Brevundimonas sp.]MDP1912160.1 hypothetical protein [Brevundimonas sp.]